MNIQMSDLTVTDPLAEKEVTIVIRVLPDNAQRPARTALVSLGVAGHVPVFASGVLENVDDLIRQAWLAYGLQAEVRQSAVQDVQPAAETVAEAAVVEEAPSSPPVQLQTARPQPRPQNLSLF